MNLRAVLAAYDAQVRRHPHPGAPEEVIERGEQVVCCFGGADGWSGVIWCGLDEGCADAVIADQVERFAGVPRPWEWKHYSHDRPHDLPDRLLAAGFVPEEPESLLVAEIAELTLSEQPPGEVTLLPVTDADGMDALVQVHDQVFGGDHSAMGRTVAAALGVQPSQAAAVVAWAGSTAIAAGRVEFHQGTDFASLWGGGTVPAWRGRGVFRALVAHRARQAADRGFRYLQVDASAASRPILLRLGFVELATTTPFIHPVGTAGAARESC